VSRDRFDNPPGNGLFLWIWDMALDPPQQIKLDRLNAIEAVAADPIRYYYQFPPDAKTPADLAEYRDLIEHPRYYDPPPGGKS
jgi:hypothetical protein